MKHGGYAYILTNKYNTVLYIGVTSNLTDRLIKHKAGFYDNAFSKRYHLTKLVYFEEFDSIVDAIKREKQLKSGSRQKKMDLINHYNPEWKDLIGRFVKV
jgi:putative endonuclease